MARISSRARKKGGRDRRKGKPKGTLTKYVIKYNIIRYDMI